MSKRLILSGNRGLLSASAAILAGLLFWAVAGPLEAALAFLLVGISAELLSSR